MDSISLPDDIKEVIHSVIDSAVRAVNVSKVYLFGSYYNGTYTEDSDIDLAFFIHNDECLIDAHRKIIRITVNIPLTYSHKYSTKTNWKKKSVSSAK